MKPFRFSLFIWIVAGLPVMGQATPKSANVAVLLSRMEARAARLQDYTVIGEGETDGKPVHYKLYFKQPDLVRIDSGRGQVTVQANGEIRGRLGHGLFGRISRRIGRDDPRLRDKDGAPFWDSAFAASLARIQSRIKAGASAALTVTPEAFDLAIRSGPTQWRYVIDPETLFFRESRRWEGGRQVEVTHYRGFRPNAGLEPRVFEF